MSIQAMAWAIEQRAVTDASARHVLLCLANYADHEGRGAFPSVARLADETGLSERTVRYKLDLLLDMGAIVEGDQRLAQVYIDRSDRRPTVYDLPGARGAVLAPRRTGCTLQQDGVQISQERGAAIAPNPSSNHQGSGESARAPSLAGDACRRMRSAGCLTTNPRHVDLLAALDEGVTPEDLEATAAEAIAGGISVRGAFAWAITTARGRRATGPRPTYAPKRETDAPADGRALVVGDNRATAPMSKTLQAVAALEKFK